METLNNILIFVMLVLGIIMSMVMIISNILEIKRSKDFWNELKRKNQELSKIEKDVLRKVEKND